MEIAYLFLIALVNNHINVYHANQDTDFFCFIIPKHLIHFWVMKQFNYLIVAKKFQIALIVMELTPIACFVIKDSYWFQGYVFKKKVLLKIVSNMMNLSSVLNVITYFKSKKEDAQK